MTENNGQRHDIEVELQTRLSGLSELAHSTGDPAVVRARQLTLLLEAEALAQRLSDLSLE